MNTSMLRRYISLAMVSAAALALISLFAAAGTRAAEPPAMPAAATADTPASAAPAPDEWPERTEEHPHHHWHAHHGSNHQVNIGHDSHLAPGETAEAVVSVFGSSTSEGEAGNVVSILGPPPALASAR